jgi:DNA-directed RNA polymerase specialized sigma24 family protein
MQPLSVVQRAGPEPPVGGEPAEFARVFDRYAVTIHRYIARRLGRTEADDLLGQTFLIAFESRPTR